MSEENIENITKSDSNSAPTFVNHHLLPDINSDGHFLINNNISIPKKLITLYISYTLNPCLRHLNTNFTLNNFLFGSVELIKNAESGKCKYSIYVIAFDSRSEFSFTDGSVGKSVIFLEPI